MERVGFSLKRDTERVRERRNDIFNGIDGLFVVTAPDIHMLLPFTTVSSLLG